MGGLLDAVVELISGRFRRVEPRRRVGTYLRGLLAGSSGRTAGPSPNTPGRCRPDGMQRLLRTADWDVDGSRRPARLRPATSHDTASGVFIVDETGFIKKGLRSAGVQRQYTGHQREDRQLSARCVPGLRLEAGGGR
ncbi:transposase [Pseudonocardia sp. Ae717_Ps2]|uniref:transposase n=1 Tax=Pseudonocardia sp. Ae717_Ps2 TaxID=1885573 RepID=UPI0009F9C521